MGTGHLVSSIFCLPARSLQGLLSGRLKTPFPLKGLPSHSLQHWKNYLNQDGAVSGMVCHFWVMHCHQPPSHPISSRRRAFVVVQLLSHILLFASPWTAARQASLSITISWSLLKYMSIESVMPSIHLILCCPLLLLPSIFPSIKVYSNKSVLRIRWPRIGASASVHAVNIQD